MNPLLIATILGLIFGILLHKGGVTDYGRIVNVFRFQDFTVLKIMLTAIVVGGIGVHILVGAEMASWEIKGADLLPLVIGSLLFGVGMAVYGYCPGTGVAAAASGKMDAAVGLLGMLVGGIVYAFTFPWLRQNLFGVMDLGKVRLNEVSGIPAGVWLAVLAIVALLLFLFIHRIERKRR